MTKRPNKHSPPAKFPIQLRGTVAPGLGPGLLLSVRKMSFAFRSALLHKHQGLALDYSGFIRARLKRLINRRLRCHKVLLHIEYAFSRQFSILDIGL